MMITWLSAGRNDPRRATAYCGGGVDGKGIARDEVTVLRGTPQIFELAASGLPFREAYKSGVLAWAPSDNPSQEEIDSVVDDFLSLCFGGLDPNDFASVVYLHRSENKVDVHVLVANVHVPTGKHFNCAPPGWQKDFDPLRDMWNWRKGWARPDDPRRARDHQPGRSIVISTARVKAGLHVEPDVKALLAGYVESCIRAGDISSQSDVVSALSKVGVINRVGVDYISIVPEGHTKPIRLKGRHFGASFDGTMPTPSFESVVEQSTDRNLDIDVEKELQAKARYQESISRRAKYNLHRFRQAKMRKRSITVPFEFSELAELKLKDFVIAERPQPIRETKPIDLISPHAAEILRKTQSPIFEEAKARPTARVTKEHYESDRESLESLFSRLIIRVREGFQRLRKASDAVAEAMRTLAPTSSGDDAPDRSVRTQAKKLPRLRR